MFDREPRHDTVENNVIAANWCGAYFLQVCASVSDLPEVHQKARQSVNIFQCMFEKDGCHIHAHGYSKTGYVATRLDE